ncbi:hypothetical protein M8J77_003707 [Diaphorina citri]|nr:hypothetical protein M8J77_003707 [Diaphorina citri]
MQFLSTDDLLCKVEEKLVLQNTRNVLNQQDRKPSGMNQAEKNIETNSKENNFDNFTCKNCGRTYTRKGNLGRHLKYECQKVPQFPCGKCTKKFYRKEKLQYHVNTIHSNMMGTPLNLNVSATHLSENGSPNVNNESPINLSTHGIHMDLNIATAHLNSRLLTSSQAAGLPNVDLGNFYQALIHKNSHNSSILSSILNNKSALMELKELTKNGTQNYWGSDYKCLNCKIDFRQKKHLTRHLRHDCPATKGSDRPFLCPHCSFRSARKYNLKVHIANQHMKMIL